MWNHTKDMTKTPTNRQDIIVSSIDGCYCRSVKYDLENNKVENIVDDMPSLEFEYYELWMPFPSITIAIKSE